MPLGTVTDRVSTREELLKDAVVSGNGSPSHTPERSTQSYTDIATGTVWEWWAGAWH